MEKQKEMATEEQKEIIRKQANEINCAYTNEYYEKLTKKEADYKIKEKPEEDVKVSEQEFKLVKQLRNLKEKGFTDDDILQLDRSKEINKENMQKLRLDTIEMNKGKIREANRAIIHKTEQIESKKSLEVSKDYLDNTKPLYILETEVDALEYNVKQLKEANKATQEEYDNDKKKK